MGLSEWVLLAVGLVLILGWWLWRQAERVDRLHRTVLASRATLDTQLVQRAAAASALATSGALDPASAVLLADVAHRALEVAPEHVTRDGLEGALADAVTGGPTPRHEAAVGRVTRESELSRALRTVLGEAADRAQLREDPRAEGPLDDLDHAWYRVQLARRFHNAHVAEVRRLRQRPVVRTLRLAGRAPMPEPIELDDRRPPD
ncbi:hypothetical protein PU560_08195 [Georgenia sp. 10Sc9-8]|uniref:NUDIX hydrolase n=1 Tax=Georgenia halotolerans TaxID=3028317 RepID=A0ABT5TWK9_9MICO|nr:hypothetical protein [Georgenia halotolerans]